MRKRRRQRGNQDNGSSRARTFIDALIKASAGVIVVLFLLQNQKKLDLRSLVADHQQAASRVFYSIYNGAIIYQGGSGGSIIKGNTGAATDSEDALIPLRVLTKGDVYPIECPHPLQPIYNHIPRKDAQKRRGANFTLPTRRIPRIMHMSMKSRCAPRDLVEGFNKWRKQLPLHEIYFHDDEAVDSLLDGYKWPEFPHLKKMMACVKFKGAMKIDVWRQLIVYKYGGIYADVDIWPSVKFSEQAPIAADDDAFFFSDAWNRPSQWFFAMAPRHPIAYYTVFEILMRLQKLEDIAAPKVVFVTGPDAMKHGYGQAFQWGFGMGENGEKDDIFAYGRHRGSHNNITATKHPQNGPWIDTVAMSAVVEYNGTNTTKKDRMHQEYNIPYWTKDVKGNPFAGSCLQLLYEKEHGG